MARVEGYTHAQAFDDGYLQVSQLHSVYYHQYGKPDGKPVIFLHGGPGSSTNNFHTRFFDPAVYRVILFDQRGCGKSLPAGETKDNTTQLLIQDIEFLREKLEIKKWHIVFGGSWGSTLALAYAVAHPDPVGSLVLRGVFLAEREDIDATMAGSLAGQLYPQEYEDLVSFLPEEKRGDILGTFYELLVGEDRQKAFEAAMVYGEWATLMGTLIAPTFKHEETYSEEFKAMVLRDATINAYYFVNGNFLEDQQLIRNTDKIKHIPMDIVQGRYDICCPPTNAWRLHKALPDSKLHWSADAGHAAAEPTTFKKLIEVCDEYGKSNFHL